MTDTRMPNFWWCPTHHLYRGGVERPCADAVKLGDVESLRVEIRAVLADFHHCGPRLPTTMLQQINDIVEREPATRCVNDTNGDGDCAACASNPDALCRQPPEVQS